jgi:Zn2+/Cd2+-exporting ATPase
MAHSFLKKMLEAESHRFHLQITTCLLGGALLLNSFLANLISNNETISSLLAMAAALMLGLPLVWQAMVDLWYENHEMNELAALSFLASFCVGEYQAAGAIAFFMIIAQLIESRSQLGARKNIESLLRLSPNKAYRLEKNKEIEIDCFELKKGDIVRVRPGESIPGDGIVIRGISSVNESSITGESLPAEKKEFDKVFGGSINVSGRLEIEISAATSNTTLAKIKKLILQAEESRTPLMRVIDQYASWYTPIILTMAAMILFFTRDINRSISILIIACPCTILLSSPTAIVAALSAAARLGVIIKNVATLEIANKVNALVFDKTGTLTTGTLNVSHITPENGVERNELLCLAASVSFHSRHPIAQAILREAENINIKILPSDHFKERSGFGTVAEVGKSRVLLGNTKWLKINKIKTPEVSHKDFEKLSILYVVKGKKVLGWIGLSDKIRPDAVEMINSLKNNSINKIVMLTGDRWGVAKKVASELGCKVEAEILPAQKMSRVVELKKAGNIVAVVGDGVNDAPALASGDVSIAMGAAGSDVAIHSASIVLMSEKLDRIPFIIHLSHHTVKIMRQNLLFSAFYILTLLILSAFGIIHPILAVIMHTASAFIVVFNSARLLREGENLS